MSRATAEHDLVSSDLARTELVRVTRRVAPDLVVQARMVLDSITLMALTGEILEMAGRLDSVELRTLDALHLAAALGLGDDLETIVTYDSRLAGAARANGVAVTTPQ